MSFQGTRGLWGPDEGRYSNIALEMVHSGDWVTPRRHPEHTHFAKPPLTYWAIAASVSVFGEHEAALRLPNALSLIATVCLLILLGRRLVPAAPWLPGLVFATSLVPFAAGNLINTDYLLTAFETLAVYGFVRLWQAGDAREARIGRLWMWAGFGLAFMTKGPPGLLPLLPMLVFLRMLPARPKLVDLPALALFALIALPWFAAVIVANPGLLDYFLGYEVYGRVFTDVHDRNSHWYGAIQVYAPVLLLGMLPWSWVLWPRLRALWRQRRALPAWWRARAIEDRWLMFIRPQAYAGSDLKKVGRRRVAVKESRDLKTWTQEHTVLVPKEGDANHFYGMTVFHCGDLFWGGLQRYETVTHHVDCELVWRPVTPFSAPLW
ncbi:MAG: Undecaprenyl phosphate-alpha-4-amino-4-deoxy-L-arabinose arabinosyl transferase [bacterium ADurb.Bin478]|nr:MAG: Undecaprenyl phosphate-alpha-4-amino-4-deoxy-L-arabinose arabinosyl transferase [bacterium ADurb.Bin478]